MTSDPKSVFAINYYNTKNNIIFTIYRLFVYDGIYSMRIMCIMYIMHQHSATILKQF